VLLLLVGILIGGASNIIGTTVTADIGKQEAIGKNVDALSTVTGVLLSSLFDFLFVQLQHTLVVLLDIN